MKKIFHVILLASLILSVGCKGHKDISSNNTKQPNTEIDNSEYELENKTIIVHGVGDSRDQQMSRENSRSNALDSVEIILRESLQSISEMRGFNPPSTDNFNITNTRSIEEKTTAYNNDKGVRIYRNRQTLRIEIEPILKKLYDQINTKDNYNWYAFLRDIDQQLNKHNTTKK